MKRRTGDQGRLAEDLAGLRSLSRPALVEQWRNLYGTEPPAYLSRSLLTRAIAYRMQENVFGGLKPSTRRFLAQVVEDASAGRQISTPPITIKPGTRLLREWHGITHEVIILDDGVQFRGKRYRSLSEVARIITGAKWSGPLFFGLKAADRKRAT